MNSSVDDMMFFTFFSSAVAVWLCLYVRNKFRHSKLAVKIRNREWDDVDNIVFAKMIGEGEVSDYTYNSYYVTLAQQCIVVSTSREREAVGCIRMGGGYDKVIESEVDGGILYEMLMAKLDKQRQEVFNALKKGLSEANTYSSNNPIAPPPLRCVQEGKRPVPPPPRTIRWP